MRLRPPAQPSWDEGRFLHCLTTNKRRLLGSGMKGMMVTVPIIEKAQPKAPKTPAFLFQNPQNKSAANNHSEAPGTNSLPGRRERGKSKKSAGHCGTS